MHAAMSRNAQRGPVAAEPALSSGQQPVSAASLQPSVPEPAETRAAAQIKEEVGGGATPWIAAGGTLVVSAAVGALLVSQKVRAQRRCAHELHLEHTPLPRVHLRTCWLIYIP